MSEPITEGLCRRHFRLEVKGHELATHNPRIPVGELRTLDQARRVVERVEADARATLEKADQDAEKIRQQVREETSHRVLQQASGLLRQLTETNRQRQETIAAYAAEVAAQALRQLAEEIPTQQRIATVVNELLRQAGKEPDGLLLVHPDDEPHLPEALRDSAWTLQTSPQVAPGSCRLTTPHGSYENAFEVRLETLIGRIRTSAASTASQTHHAGVNASGAEATHSGTPTPDEEG